MHRIVRPAFIGVLSTAFGVALAQLLAAATRPQAAPLVAVGGTLIDATPTPIKEFAVRELGTHDKPVLLASIGLVLALFTAVVGILAARHRSAAVIGAAVFGIAGAAAALQRPASTWFDPVPSLLGAAVAGATLLLLLHRERPAVVTAEDGSARTFDRRAFLRASALVAGGAALAGGGAELILRARGGATANSRAAIRLPAPASSRRTPPSTGSTPP